MSDNTKNINELINKLVTSPPVKVHYIYTDFETDDMISIKDHSRLYPDAFTIVVVGEGVPHKKIAWAERFMRLNRPSGNFIVMQGIGSDKDYPTLPIESAVEPDSEEVILDRIRSLPKPEVIFELKPPREEIACGLDRTGVIFVTYGSFNWRTMLKPVGGEAIQQVLKGRKDTYYFDSFGCIGEKNSGNFVPDMNDPVDVMIVEMAMIWNNHILAQCVESVKEIDAMENPSKKDLEKRHRNQKIIDSISKNIAGQFVMADVCLFRCPPPTIRARLDGFTEVGYPIWVPDETSNILIHDAAGKDERQAGLVATFATPGAVWANPLASIIP